MYYPTIPLTVLNNLEGGSSNNDYEITWHNPNPDIVIPWQFGIDFNAFNFENNSDIYSATASEQFQALGTTWWLHHWDNGSTNTVRPNIQVTAPTTITAYYKGHFRSNDQNAISSNSQRKIVRTDNGIYHVVYESLGQVWYTHSLTSDYYGSWSQDYNIINGEDGQAKNPSIDFEGNIIKIVFEMYAPFIYPDAGIFLVTWEPDANGNYPVEFNEGEDVLHYSSSYFGNAKPVIAYNSVVVFFSLQEEQHWWNIPNVEVVEFRRMAMG